MHAVGYVIVTTRTMNFFLRVAVQMDAINAARLAVFAFDVVVPFVPPCQLVWVQNAWVRGGVLIIIGLLAALDPTLALLVALGYLETEIFFRTQAVKAAHRDDAVREYRALMRGTLVGDGVRTRRHDGGAGDLLPPKEPPQPFLTPESLRKAAEDNVVPGSDFFDGVRVAPGWASAQGYGDDDNLLPAI